MKIVFASSNAGKIQELQSLLTEVNVEIIPQSVLGVVDADETACTFVENALIKARHACRETGLPAIADDSGLAVNALAGAPGIYSARYAGLPSNAAANIKKLLAEMANIPVSERTAFFHCVLVFMLHAEDPTPLICHGIWEGRILQAEQGEKGFGYDPVFFVESEGKSAAQLPLEIKNRISHRGQALRILLKLLPGKHYART